MNFDYFLPITIWKSKKTPQRYHFTDKSGEFWKDLSLTNEENKKMKDYWTQWKVFYAFPFSYLGLTGRAFTIIRIYQEENFPYHTSEIVGNLKRVNQKPYLIFKTYLYPFPDTTLLFVNQKQDQIDTVILYDKETQKDKKLTKLYNFLPNAENKNVLWYERFCPYLTKFLYVYETKPTFTHWKLSSEYVCLPTHDTNAFPSLLECTNAMSGKIRNKRVFVQNSSEPLYVLSTVSKHPFQVRTRKLPSTVDSFALILCLLLLYYSINFS